MKDNRIFNSLMQLSKEELATLLAPRLTDKEVEYLLTECRDLISAILNEA